MRPAPLLCHLALDALLLIVSHALLLSILHRCCSRCPGQAVREVLKATPRRPYHYSVVAVVLSNDRKAPASLAYVDVEGALKAQKPMTDTIWHSHKEAVLKEFILDHRPDVIVINASAGQGAVLLRTTLVTSVINNVAEEIRNRARERRARREDNDNYYGAHQDDEDEAANYNAHVVVIRDEVSNIYKLSPRAKKAFPEFSEGVWAAICLARYAQEPLAEYASLWTSCNSVEVFGYEALFLDVHPLKHLLGNVKLPLLRALEHCLVDAVCEAGVDMLMAVNHDHLSPLLIFVAGLGLRKSEALKQAVRKRGARGVISRNELLEKKLLGKVVWTNAASFLRFPEERARNANEDWDPFEDTRIHPECYLTEDFAPKICADALEVEHDPMRYHENVVKQMNTSRKKMNTRLLKDEEWVDQWVVPRAQPPMGAYPGVGGMGMASAGVVVEMKRPTGEYLMTKRVTTAAGETEVRPYLIPI